VLTKTLTALAAGLVCDAAGLATVLTAEAPYTIGYATGAPLNIAIIVHLSRVYRPS
jgi:hypothetical protein